MRRVLGALAVVGCLATLSVSSGAQATVQRGASRSAALNGPVKYLLARPGHASWARWRAAQGGRQSGSADRAGTAGVSVPVGSGPQAAAVDAATHTLYVVNGNGGTVSVINAATCNAAVTSGCDQVAATVAVGSFPVAIAIDQATDTIYVANSGDNTVSVINGAICNANDSSECSQAPPTVAVGSVPLALDLNQATDTIYVANFGNGTGTTVSVINGATCNGTNASGCSQTPATITVGTSPFGIVVDPTTDTIYVGVLAPDNSESVAVVNGATCNATDTAGCSQTPPTVSAGSGSTDETIAMAIDQATSTLYVANYSDNTLSVIDKATCNSADTAGCGQAPAVVRVGSGPTGIAVDSAIHTIYVSNGNDNTVTATDAADCNALNIAGCDQPPAGAWRTGRGPNGVTIDPATDTVYTANGDSNTVSVLDGATCNATVTSGCTRFPPAVPVGDVPEAAAINDATATVYIVNQGDNTVSLIDAATCNDIVTSGCSHAVATVPVGHTPAYLAVDQATDTIYVPNFNDNTVSVIDGKTCNATDTAGCSQTPPVISVPGQPTSIAVNEVTDTVYVGTFAGTVAVINGATCNSTHHGGCGQTPATVAVPGPVGDIAVNPVTDTIYSANGADTAGNTVSVINGKTCNATATTGCSQTPATVTLAPGAGSGAVAVDLRTNTVYVPEIAGLAGTQVAMINGSTCDAEVTTGCGQAPPTFTSGNAPAAVRVDQVTNTVYIVNLLDYDVVLVNGHTCNATVTTGCANFPTLVVGGFPLAIAVSQLTGSAYVPNGNDNTVSVIGPPHQDGKSIETATPAGRRQQ